MLQSIKGICRDGRVELLEPVPAGANGQVIVTFLGSESVDLVACGIDEAQAAGLRHRLTTFADDWRRPEMDLYDGA